MRIGINGLFWPQEFTGSGQYTRHLWQALHQIDEGEDTPEYYLLGSGQPFAGLSKEQQMHLSPPVLVQQRGEKLQKLWWEQIGVTQLANQRNQRLRPFDLVHYPYFAAPLRLPQKPTAVVVTIHDLIPLVLPEYAAGRAAKAYFRLVSTAARRADLILADSEYSKRDILRLLKISPSKVAVVYLGVDERYRAGELPADQQAALFQKYGLQPTDRLIFYLGGYDLRKNVPNLIKAFGLALPKLKELEAQDGGGRWVLAMAGKTHSNNPVIYPDVNEPMRQAVGIGEDADRVRFIGLVDEADKPLLYRAASFYVFPSRYEGFGLDPLEAIASGAPTICSNASSLPEVVGEAALLVEPDDLAGWKNAIENLAARPQLRRELAMAGPLQAQKFSWDKTARRTLELYRMLECIETRGRK